MPVYLLLGLVSFAFSLSFSGPYGGPNLLVASLAVLLSGFHLRLGPTIIAAAFATLVGIAAATAVATNAVEAVVVILAAMICGFALGFGLDQVLGMLSTFALGNVARDTPLEPYGNLPETAASALRKWLMSKQPQGPVYSVPRRFDLALMLVVFVAYALLFSVLQMLHSPPAVFLGIAVFFTSVGLGQALLFGGKNPRLASELVGGGFFLALAVIGTIVTARHGVSAALPNALSGLLCGVPIGFVFGYLAGTLVGGIFLVAHAVRKRIGQAPPEDLDAEQDGGEIVAKSPPPPAVEDASLDAVAPDD